MASKRIFYTKMILPASIVFFLIIACIGYSPSAYVLPTGCQDSDGNCNVANINVSDVIFESVDLLTYPYGWINASGYSFSIPSQNSIDSAVAHVIWKTDLGFGAENINIDYWNGSQWVNCAGPFQENSSVSDTKCDVSSLTKDQINGMKIMLRGEDSDGFPNAFAYVDSMRLELNHSAPPQWDNQTTNASQNKIFIGESVNLSAQFSDDIGLSYAWLSTNESGQWLNYTPIYLNGLKDSWMWVNFSWKNDSFSGVMGWKIYANDTTGKENATNNGTFLVQFRLVPKACQDSDGNCNAMNINKSDGTFETLDLMTYPYGWINTTAWSANLSDDSLVQNSVAHVIWKTDLGFGAENINIDYWNGSQWVNCAGPFQENSSVSDTKCDVSSLTKDQINGMKIMLRGEDSDGFPNAFAYVDFVYLEVNYTSGTSYLEVDLISPDASAILNVIQNNTFIVNATVFCRSNSCGDVDAVLRYNLSSPYPDTDMNTTAGDKPFYIQEVPSLAAKPCPNNPLDVGEFCNVTWVVNATGSVAADWKVGVLFNSSYQNANSTENASVSITSCTEDISLNWITIDFGSLDPSTGPNSALGNSESQYNVSINPGSCNMDIYIRGTNLTNATLNSKINVSSVAWSNTSNDFLSSYALAETNQYVTGNVLGGTNVTTWYWINVPAIYAGNYNGTLTVTGVKSV